MPRVVPLPLDLLDRPFTRAEALRLGLGEKRLRGADLRKPFHGVRRVGELGTVRERAESYAAVMDEVAFFCGPTAAALLGMPIPLFLEGSAALHVAVPNPHRAPRGRGVRGHKLVVDDTDLRDLDGLPSTTAARTWADLAGVLTPTQLVVAGDWVLRAGTSRDELAEVIDRHPGRRGRPARKAV